MLTLPTGEGDFVAWAPSGDDPIAPEHGGFTSRVAYAAAHVIADPFLDPPTEGLPPIDWDATLLLRRHLWDLGFGVAEAMDTAQRGAGVEWETARELITRTAATASGPAVYGALTDQLASGGRFTLEQITDAYHEQVAFIEEHGGTAIVMASRHLASAAKSPEDYIRVYRDVIAEASRPVLIHWLGEAFDPALAGYWGSSDVEVAADIVLDVIADDQGKVSGLKLSVLDAGLEVRLRRRLPQGVAMFTGDDLDYVDLIQGDAEGHSDALLGILGPIAPVAATALQALDAGDIPRYRSLLEPTLALSRQLFSAPTFHYKTGVVFLAYVSGLQDHFRMVSGAEGARSLPHLARLLILADQARLIPDPELAVHRMRLILELGGVS